MALNTRPTAPPTVLLDAAGRPLALGASVVLRGKITTLWPDLPRCNVIVSVDPAPGETEQRPSEFALHAHRLRQEVTTAEWRSMDVSWHKDWARESARLGLHPDEKAAIETFIESVVARVTKGALMLAEPA